MCDFINKIPNGTNVCAMIGVKWYGGRLECDEEKLGAIFRDNRGVQSKRESQTKSIFID